MRTIAHLSDLHFGTEDPQIARALLEDVTALAPNLTVMSGDFTQRARSSQFKAARDYLKLLPQPQLCVPGNHDIPLYDIFHRFLMPLRRYRKYISRELCPFYQDAEMGVIGINTSRSLTWKSGRISYVQMDMLKKRLLSIPAPALKVVVTHHPFIPPPGEEHAGIDLLGRASKALKTIDGCGADLLLAGHLHQGYNGDVRSFYPATKSSIIVAQAGTGISRRLREASNAYNFLTLEPEHISVSVREWNGSAFAQTKTVSYYLRNKEWRLETA